MSIPLSISRISEAISISDSSHFQSFCITELKNAEQVVKSRWAQIPFDTVLFQSYVVLDYRQERMTLPISDRLLEVVFHFLCECMPLYKSDINLNTSNCFSRLFRTCVLYLDNAKNLRGPESLSENTTIQIFDCLQCLLECVSPEQFPSFLHDLSTPFEETNSIRFYNSPFLPDESLSPSAQFLRSDAAQTYYVILLYRLNTIVDSSSHSLTRSALLVMECLFLAAGSVHLVPLLPSILSTLAIRFRSESLLSWREKALMVFAFSHALYLTVNSSKGLEEDKKETRKEVNEDGEELGMELDDVSRMISDWVLSASTPSTTVTATIPKDDDNSSTTTSTSKTSEQSLSPLPGESNVEFQARRVLSELHDKVPPLINLVLLAISAESHLTFRLIANQALSLLLVPAIYSFPAILPAILDSLVADLADDRPTLADAAHVVARRSLHYVLKRPSSRAGCLDHVIGLLRQLPKVVRIGTEREADQATRQVYGYLLLLDSEAVKELIDEKMRRRREDDGNDNETDKEEEEEFDGMNSYCELYGLFKQTFEIQQVVTVGGEFVQSFVSSSSSSSSSSSPSLQASTYFRVEYRYISSATASILTQLLSLLAPHFVSSSSKTIMNTNIRGECEIDGEFLLMLLEDLVQGNEEAALITPIVLQSAPAYALTSLIETVLDTAKLSLRKSLSNIELLLWSVTKVVIQSHSTPSFLPTLLSLLVYYRSQSDNPGPVLAALADLANSEEEDSVLAMIWKHADYLVDSVLLNLRMAEILPSNVLNANVCLLESLWKDLLRVMRDNEKKLLLPSSSSTTTATTTAVDLRTMSEEVMMAHVRDCIAICCNLVNEKRVVEAIRPLLPLSQWLVIMVNQQINNDNNNNKAEKEGEEREEEWNPLKHISEVIDQYFDEKMMKLASIEPCDPLLEMQTRQNNSNESESESESESEDNNSNIIHNSTPNPFQPTEEERQAEKEKESITLLQQILHCIQYLLRTRSLHTPRTVIDIIQVITHLSSSSSSSSTVLLAPLIPLLAIILRVPTSPLFLSAWKLITAIAGRDTRVGVSHVVDCWPMIRYVLEGCLLSARSDDYSVVGNRSRGEELEVGVLEMVCEQYKDEVLWSTECSDICEFIDERWGMNEGEIPEIVRRFVTLAVRYNLDEVMMYLHDKSQSHWITTATATKMGNVLCPRFCREKNVMKEIGESEQNSGLVCRLVKELLV